MAPTVATPEETPPMGDEETCCCDDYIPPCGSKECSGHCDKCREILAPGQNSLEGYVPTPEMIFLRLRQKWQMDIHRARIYFDPDNRLTIIFMLPGLPHHLFLRIDGNKYHTSWISGNAITWPTVLQVSPLVAQGAANILIAEYAYMTHENLGGDEERKPLHKLNMTLLCGHVTAAVDVALINDFPNDL
jgi:hypothetical protein